MRTLVVAARVAALLASVAAATACDEPPKVRADASVLRVERTDAGAPASTDPPPKPTLGCLRGGTVEGAEADPSCILQSVPEDVMRDLSRRLEVTLALEPETVVSGAAATVRLTITNTSSVETLVVLDAHTHAPGPRTDWKRLSGVPDIKGEPAEMFRVRFGLGTSDRRERAVDAVPVVTPAQLKAMGREPTKAELAPTTTRVLGIRLRPGAKLTHSMTWMALRIPAPAPIYKDDAGHRYVPKTTAFPLPAGEYNVTLDIPFHGLTPPERTFSTPVTVERVKQKP